MAGPTLSPPEDVEEFIEQVDEVHRLIEGLKEGTISPDYIDTKQKIKEEKQKEKLKQVQQSPAARGPAPSGRQPTEAQQHEDAADEDAEAERREKAMAKVKELMANRDRKLRARARYEEYVQSQDKSRFGTDYTKWDIWCPDDEEDDLINSIGPNTPQFRAMEKDIDERHKQMVERRQLAERCRVRGNEAYTSRQYSEALRCYQGGLESERTNMTLHANAAMAALKMNCYVQAVEHCDKVLSIAEFLHNHKAHPLCVKALQRRAEAYRALQQTSRAVADLTWALDLDPGNAEVAKQLVKARVEDEEARKQRAIAKAVSRAGAAAAAAGGGAVAGGVPDAGTVAEGGAAAASSGSGMVEAAGLTLDLEKLGAVEKLAALLVPAEATGGVAEYGSKAAEEEDGAPEPQETAKEGPGRGPSLPPRAQARSSEAAAPAVGGQDAGAREAAESAPAASTSGRKTTAQICEELRGLLRDDDACCVYLRECGGLQNVAARISKRRHGNGGGPPDPGLAALLLLLNDACMNDGNLKQLPALKVLPAVVAALSASGPADEAPAAAVTLLCTVVTNEDVRREVSKLLGTAEALSCLIKLLTTAKPVVQGVALALLGNCMVDKPTKAATGAVWRADATTSACFLALLRSPNTVIAEKAAVLLGNMATDAALRSDILERQGGIVRQLLALTATEMPAKAAAAAAVDLQRAAGTALFNFTVEPAGQRLVAEDAEGLGRLYRLATAGGAGTDLALAARATGVCARAARVPEGATTLLGLGAVVGMLGAATAALEGLEGKETAKGETGGRDSGGPSGGAAGDPEANAAVLDAAVRTLTILTSPEDAAAVSGQVLASGGVSVLLRALRAAGSGLKAGSDRAAVGTKAAAKAGAGAVAAAAESVLANAALCLGALARSKDLLPQLRSCDPVPVLLRVAHEGRGNTASKNAAIALARLAHDPAMLEKLRELHGIEIIYQYVKP